MNEFSEVSSKLTNRIIKIKTDLIKKFRNTDKVFEQIYQSRTAKGV